MYSLKFFHTVDDKVTIIHEGFSTLEDAQRCLYEYAAPLTGIYYERDCDGIEIGFAYYSNVGKWGYRYYIEGCPSAFDQAPWDKDYDYPIATNQAPVNLLQAPVLLPSIRQAAIIPSQYSLVAWDGAQDPTFCDYCDLVADWIEDNFGFFSHPVIVATLYFAVLGLVLTHLTNR